MSKRKFTKKELLNLVIKKATGYHYSEEVFEYEKTQINNKCNKISRDLISNYNFFDICDRGQTQSNKINDTLTISNEENLQQNNEDLTLIKKKVTTHYIPPDMLAIKILFEIYGKEIEYDNLTNLSDKELLNLKNQLLKDILNDN